MRQGLFTAVDLLAKATSIINDKFTQSNSLIDPYVNNYTPNLNINKKITDDINYGIIMDAGSTGTRIFVYEWEDPKNCLHSPYIRPSFRTSGPWKGKQFKIKKVGGLAEVAPSAVPNYLKDFIGNATEFIPSTKHANTPIFLKATAGMRLLPRSQAHNVMQAVRQVFRESPFKFDEKFGVQVIPGEYEGVFGWLAINYLDDVLSEEGKPSLGMMDMGGASSQITFETPQVPMENAFPINLNGTSRVVYTHSYLRFGRNEARVRYHTTAFDRYASDNNVNDPCFVKGYQGISHNGYNFTGSGDFAACLLRTQPLTLKDPFCPTQSCAINGVYQPRIPDAMELVGISGMYKTARWFKCHGKRNARCLLNKATEVCTKLNLNQYSKKFNKWSDDKDFNNYCFMAAYLINMLNSGYNIHLDRTINFSQEVNNVDVGWTLGAMVYEVNLLYPSGQCCNNNKLKRIGI